LRRIEHRLSGQGTGTGDNYAYLVVDDKTRDAMVVDPAHPPEYVKQGFWNAQFEYELTNYIGFFLFSRSNSPNKPFGSRG